MRLLRSSLRTRAALAHLAATLAARRVRAQTIEEKAQLCAACHGENGIPQQKTTPVIWGQHQGYLYLQLRDYKSGARKNDIMTPLAQTLERDDMMALAQLFLAEAVARSAASRAAPRRRGRAGAARQHRDRLHIGALRPRRHIGRRRRLLQVGPALLREIERQRHHVVALSVCASADMISLLRAPLL